MRASRLTAPVLLLVASAFAIAAARPELQEPAQPTDHHRRVLANVGEWEGTLTTFMPGAPSEAIPAREHTEAVGAFWTQSRFECEFMGAPYVGTGCMGYDTAKKKYVGTWIDSMTTTIALMEGDLDPKTGAIVMHWDSPDPATGALVHQRSETVTTRDGYTSTFFMGEGAGTKSMVIAMKRVAAKATEAGADK